MMPSKDEDGKRILKCKCGSSNDISGLKMKEQVKQEQGIEVVDKDFQTMPKVEEECPKCKNNEAYMWTKQTRAGDEPETKFFKCTKCKHTWRDYS